ALLRAAVPRPTAHPTHIGLSFADSIAVTTSDTRLASAASAGLRYVTDDRPGIRRVMGALGFRYTRADGRPVRSAADLKRIRTLAIPPAWKDVWICPDPKGHLQATGRDKRGRQQNR